MSTSTVLRRRAPPLLYHLRSCSTATSELISQPRRRYPPPCPHDFSNPSAYLGSWEPPSNPREAEAQLERLRKGYAKQMKQVRKEYAHEMEMLRLEKQRKDEAAKEARMVENQRRKAEKAVKDAARAVERKAVQEEFRQMLTKERAQKLESWRAKEELRENKKKQHRELLHKQSSLWIAEKNLEEKIADAIRNAQPL